MLCPHQIFGPSGAPACLSSYSSVNYLQTSYRTSRRSYVKMADYSAGPSSSFENENILENQQCVPDSKKLCKVCSAPAGKHIYYGARTCISCRGFFRRSVQNNHHQFFGCSNADSQAQWTKIEKFTRKIWKSAWSYHW